MSGLLDIYSGNLEECPNCGSTRRGDFLYQCRDTHHAEHEHCGKVFCEHCAEDSHDCPHCGSLGDILGKIDPEAKYYIQASAPHNDLMADSQNYSPLRVSAPPKGLGFLLLLLVLSLLWFILPARTGETQENATVSVPSAEDAGKPIGN